MNTRFLLTLCAVAESGSVAAAARRLGLATASASEQIRALEKDVGASLLARRGRTVVLTEAGEAVLPAVREVLTRVDDLRQLAQAGQPRGRLRVGAISTALVSVVPPALRLLAARSPRLEVKVSPGSGQHLYRLLDGGELDCVLTPRPPFPLPKSLLWRELRLEPLTLVVPAGLPGDDIHGLLRAAPLIRMDRQSWTGRLVTRFLDDRGIAPAELFEMDAPEAITILVSQGLGITLLPDWGIQPPAGQDLRKLPVAERRYARSVGVIIARLAREELAAQFADALVEGMAAGAALPG